MMHKSSEIKALRKRMGLTHAGFALAVGCAVQTVRNWERGCAVQPRYRNRLDAVASRQAVDSNTPAGEPVNVLAVIDGDDTALFCKGKPPMVGRIGLLGLPMHTTVTAWLGVGVKYNLTVAEVTTGELATAY